MKGTDWGRIVARVMSVVLVLKSLTLASSTLSYYLESREYFILAPREYSDEIPAYLYPEIGLAVLLLVLATLFWKFSDRFSPIKDGESEEPKDSLTVATVFVAAMGAYFFFWQGGLALEEGPFKSFDYFSWEMKKPSFVFHIVTTALSVAIVLKSKALAAWMAK